MKSSSKPKQVSARLCFFARLMREEERIKMSLVCNSPWEETNPHTQQLGLILHKEGIFHFGRLQTKAQRTDLRPCSSWAQRSGRRVHVKLEKEEEEEEGPQGCSSSSPLSLLRVSSGSNMDRSSQRVVLMLQTHTSIFPPGVCWLTSYTHTWISRAGWEHSSE